MFFIDFHEEMEDHFFLQVKAFVLVVYSVSKAIARHQSSLGYFFPGRERSRSRRRNDGWGDKGGTTFFFPFIYIHIIYLILLKFSKADFIGF